MPELPDIEVYLEALRRRVIGHRLTRIRIRGPGLVRTVDPSPDQCEGRRVVSIARQGKKVVIELDDELYLAIHLMVAGRLLWADHECGGQPPRGGPSRIEQARFLFESGTLVLTEAGSIKRASLHLVRGRESLAALDPGGVDPLTCTPEHFGEILAAERRTLKRVLTDPTVVSGIGNSYSDEILWEAGLSPVARAPSLGPDRREGLRRAMVATLTTWKLRLMGEFDLLGDGRGRFPGPREITAFRPDFGVHGRFGKPCPRCGAGVQRIVRAENEVNYCPRCQTGGRVLADRSLSRLLGKDWPRTVEEWEERPRPSG